MKHSMTRTLAMLVALLLAIEGSLTIPRSALAEESIPIQEDVEVAEEDIDLISDDVDEQVAELDEVLLEGDPYEIQPQEEELLPAEAFSQSAPVLTVFFTEPEYAAVTVRPAPTNGNPNPGPIAPESSGDYQLQ